MSDGGKENGKQSEQSTRKPAGNEDFVLAIAKISVAQICENEGFQSFQQSALEAFTDVMVRYVKEIGKTANRSANLGGRSECNVFDVIQGLEELGSIQGFSGASDIHHSLVDSGTIKEIYQYVSLVERIPFVFSLPGFPVSRQHKPPLSFLQIGEDPPDEHIPVWLPVFPHPETRIDSNTCKGIESIAHTVRAEDEVNVDKKGEGYLMNFEKRLTSSNGFEAGLCQELIGDSSKSKRAADINPFLAPPLRYGEKEISYIDLPSKLSEGDGGENHVPMMETFAPVIEAADNKLNEAEEREKDTQFDGRPTVRLQFSSRRKSLPISVNLFDEANGDENRANCFHRDDEKDGNKRKAEQNFEGVYAESNGSESIVN